MLEHGGNLQEAVTQFARPLEDWLDLSTGINPQPYPAPPLHPHAWHRLPKANDELLSAAKAYYNAPHLLAVAGTQAAIQALPRLRPPSRVAVAAPSYAEHAHGWRQARHAVQEVPYSALNDAVHQCDVMVVCNPNNPTGATVPPEQLLRWAAMLAKRQGWLVVDEAFADTTPELSVTQQTGQPGLIVLRSVGKFFGLAGVRLGFVAAEPSLLNMLNEWLGPWTVSGPAQDIGCAALLDRAWQQTTRAHLHHAGTRLHELLQQHGMDGSGCALFQWWPETDAEVCWQHMAGQGIWVRLFRQHARGIRLGLPADEVGWQRLQHALATWKSKKESR